METRRSRFNMWTLVTLVIFVLYLLFLLYPIVMVLAKAVFVNGTFSLDSFTEFFTNPYYSETLANSFAVSVTATVFALLLGSSLGYVFAMFQFRGKQLLQILIVIASMSPPFVGAYSWILLLGRNGTITNFLMDVLHFPQIEIYGFAGIVLVFTLQLFPLVFMYVSGALKNVDSSVLEAAASMGCTGVRRFFHVLLPLMMPTVVASALLVFMRAFADFGTPMLIGEGFRTFPVTIYQQFISEVGGNDSFAAALAIVAIVIALLVFLGQQIVANRFSFTMNSLHPIDPMPVRSWKKVLLYVFVYGVVFVAILPQLYLVYTSFLKTSGMIFVPGYSLDSYVQAFTRMGSSIINTLRIPLIGLAIVLVVGTSLSYVAIRHRNVLTRLTDTLGMLPYIIPGTVLGIAFISAFNTGVFGSGFLAITGTVAIMAISFALRRLPYTVRSSEAALRQIPVTIEEAAESLGSSRLNTFLKITVPMMASGIVSGAILTWITMISELSTSVLLYTVRTRTVTVAIYTEVIRGNYGIAAALSTILMVFTVVSLLLFMKVSKSKDITMA
ncbi:ABC transporter permease [Thermophilibacter provencensis]|uniref:Iron ABC transporter permease n=1 Tax=Thermophilibacter provencensis TaxID=1852386 RepID=A0ABT7V1Z7_9ACTN|nr:iron ABC transporter permease [Thermophilibacter provencensis]MDM8270619.1 iron ABC transporter permease [Thermophilibacter provencensis]